MPEDQGAVHDDLPDPALREPVDVRTANADGTYLDEHLAGAGFGDGALLDLDLAQPDHYSHGCGRHRTHRSAVASQREPGQREPGQRGAGPRGAGPREPGQREPDR